MTETTDRCDVSKINIGSTWSRHSHGVVVAISNNDITIKTPEKQWDISKPIVAKEFSFADQHNEGEIQKITRTNLISILLNNPQTAMTIVFNKKPDVKIAAETLRKGQGNMLDRDWNHTVRVVVSGEERTMIGYHEGALNDFGRLQFYESEKGPRQVDPRTLQSVLVARKQYLVK